MERSTPTTTVTTRKVKAKGKEQRSTEKASPTITTILAYCNTNDRFNLLEDPNIPLPNLDNPIHPIFKWFTPCKQQKRMLQLASQFLAHECLLEFFVPLLYGRVIHPAKGSGASKYLTNPLDYASDFKRQELLQGIREALNVAAVGIHFKYTDFDRTLYGRTVISSSRCIKRNTHPAFQTLVGAEIGIAAHLADYYNDSGPNGYEKDTLCAQLRHDFMFAVTILHELVHALGVLRRGDLSEPLIRQDFPHTEWGHAWEHFMFGCIINPQERRVPGTHILMRRPWCEKEVAELAGGMEYADVSMEYVAQWFRQETWDIVAERSPTGIPLPITRFKVQSSNARHAWVVSSACMDVREDLVRLRMKEVSEMEREREEGVDGKKRRRTANVMWWLRKTGDLQEDDVWTPFRPSRTRARKQDDWEGIVEVEEGIMDWSTVKAFNGYPTLCMVDPGRVNGRNTRKRSRVDELGASGTVKRTRKK